jgi:hypothetical protein
VSVEIDKGGLTGQGGMGVTHHSRFARAEIPRRYSASLFRVLSRVLFRVVPRVPRRHSAPLSRGSLLPRVPRLNSAHSARVSVPRWALHFVGHGISGRLDVRLGSMMGVRSGQK